ncbi:hypothetical protein Tco_0890045 [Tanacetum coccineum]
MLQFQPAHSDIRNNNDRQRHCCGCELNHTVTSEGLAQAHVFLQATQEPFQIDWYLHAQSLIPAVHMVCNNDAMHNDILEESTFKIPERIEYVRRIASLNFEQNKALGWHLEEIHVTWTQFGKKRDKIATLHEEAQKLHTVREDDVAIPCDGVKMLKRRR